MGYEQYGFLGALFDRDRQNPYLVALVGTPDEKKKAWAYLDMLEKEKAKGDELRHVEWFHREVDSYAHGHGGFRAASDRWSAKLDSWTEDFLRDWYASVLAAMTALQIQPGASEKDDFFLLGLLANLLWAVAVFFPPTSAAAAGSLVAGCWCGTRSAVSLISLATPAATDIRSKVKLLGYALKIGSSMLQASSTPRPGSLGPGAGYEIREAILSRMSENKDTFEAEIKKSHWQIGSKLTMAFGDDPAIVADRGLAEAIFWRWIFPGIEFKKRTEQSRKTMVQSIMAVLADYNRQYESWRKGLMIYQGINYAWGEAGVRAYSKNHPFLPDLKFNLPIRKA
jgi:hypothetical protein